MTQSSSYPAFSQRQLRVGELVKQNLGEIFIRNEAKIPSVNTKVVTVTEVRMSPDLSIAKIYLSIFGGKNNDEVFEKIMDSKKYIRHQLSQAVKNQLRKTPDLHFYRDDSLDYAQKIEELLK